MMAVTTLGDMDIGEAPVSSNGDPTAESSVLATTYGSRTVGDCDASMSDEECIAQLAELCKDITPPTNPEAELEKTLAWLDAMMSGTEDGVTQSAGGSSASQVSCAMENDSTSTGSNGCMRLEDLIDYAMVLDTTLEVDPSGSEDSLEDLVTPKDESMELDEMPLKTEWSVGTHELRTMCPLDMHM
ncbi:hypothetical protein FRC07_001380 [Ceratobasidium sp. 392]|nr:hypothetical protein FRC07_001380 [Ceratobasidium sp. 392]